MVQEPMDKPLKGCTIMFVGETPAQRSVLESGSFVLLQ